MRMFRSILVCTGPAGVVAVDGPVSAEIAELELHKESSRNTFTMLGFFSGQPAAFTQCMMPYMFAKPQPTTYLQQLVDKALKTPTDIPMAMCTSRVRFP